MAGRWTYRTSATGVLVLAAAAFTLSYDALHQLALDSRVRPGLAWMWPVMIDGTIVVALLTVLAAKRASARAGYPWALAGLFSVAFNVAPSGLGKLRRSGMIAVTAGLLTGAVTSASAGAVTTVLAGTAAGVAAGLGAFAGTGFAAIILGGALAPRWLGGQRSKKALDPTRTR
jgi:Protein of unknown function (DUF2637)